MPSPLSSEIHKRRTFAIISHPDAGKTTLTEKFLLYGGAVQLAGSVRARKNQRQTTSDWMAMERERGISITSTVLQFPYRGCVMNLLDTPGHQDFSEDTYRTLMAVDSAVMVIDNAKGIEAQTKKLFQVCRLRNIPIFTFINKLDRPGQEPLALLDEVESVLGIEAVPMNWPLGDGPHFRGVYDRESGRVHLFERTEHGKYRAPVQVTDIQDPTLLKLLGSEELHRKIRQEIELLDGAGASFDPVLFRQGRQTPVFFGSALTNFGVELFLDAYTDLAPGPQPREAEEGPVGPEEEDFSGFIFKIQSNMDPQHRDSIAFLRVVSGRFERNTAVRNSRTGEEVRVTRSLKLFGQEREVVDEAYPGDIIGLSNPGKLQIGDTLYTGRPVTYHAIPRFHPEHFAVLRNTDTGRYKQFNKGLVQLEAEGAIQVFYATDSLRREPILGAVGELQFDVVLFRLKSEYGVDAQLERLPGRVARWVEGDPGAVEQIRWGQGLIRAEDTEGRLVALFEGGWQLRYFEEKHPELDFVELGSADAALTRKESQQSIHQ